MYFSCHVEKAPELVFSSFNIPAIHLQGGRVGFSYDDNN